jgi:predicted porin
MRKLLYATTALTTAALIAGTAEDAAAQAAPTPPSPSPYREQLPTVTPQPAPAPTPYVSKSAERIKLGLSGYFQEWAVATDQNFRTKAAPGASSKFQPTNDVTNKHNSEICVIGQTTLDNGLTIGVNVQIEAFSEGDTIDESYLFLQSPTAGQLIVGDENNAGYLLHVTAPDGGISLDSGDLTNIVAFELGTGIPIFDTPLGTTNLRLNDNDSGKFTYITPRFAGFQAGVSYIPEFTAGGDNNSSLRKAGTPVVAALGGTAGRAEGQYDGVAGGLNFTDTFGPVGIQASGGTLWAQGFSGGPNISHNDLIAYNAGVQLSFAGFSIGGGWLYVPQGQRGINGAVAGVPAGTPLKFNGQSWTAGAAYGFGPYKVGLDYMTGDNNSTSGGGKDRLEQAVVSGTYTLGPGIRLVGGVMYYDWQQENRLSQNSGVGGLTGLKLAF